MAIKINNKDLYRRVINQRDVQKVILNWSQIRPTSQWHIDYHVISNRGTWWWGWGGWTGTPWWWSSWGSTTVWEHGVSNWWETGSWGHGQGKANLNYDWLPSLMNAYKVEIIYYFYWNQTDIEDADGRALDSYLAWGDNRTYTADIYEYGQDWAVWLEFQIRILKLLSWATEWDYVMTVVLDLQNKKANLTLQWPDSFSQSLYITLVDSEVYNIRHSDKFLVILNDWVRLSRTDFFVYNNLPAQPVWAGIYHNGILGVISLSSDWSNWMTIADKNLWATMVWNQWDSYTDSNCWGFFQWGNNYMFPLRWAITTSPTQVDTTGYWPWNYYSDSTFIIWHNNWSSIWNNNLRWGETGTNIAMQGPCVSWFHVPSFTQVNSLFSIMNDLYGTGNRSLETLKIPLVWLRVKSNGASAIWWAARYWTTTATSSDNARLMRENTVTSKANWCSIRPFANTPVVPDSTRTVLYQPS